MKKTLIITSMSALFAGAVYAQTSFVGGNTDGADYNGNIVSNVSGEYASIAGFVNSGTSIKIENGASVTSIYGGGTKVELYGTASSVVGGGHKSDVEGGTNVIVDSANASLSQVVGAGYQGGNVTGDVNVTLKNGTVNDMFVGGSREGGNVNGNINIDMTGGNIKTYLVGGNYQSQNSVIDGNIDISITGGSVSHGVRGGSMGDAGPIMKTNGNVTIYVGGDAYIGKSGGEAISSAGSYATVKDVTITVADNAVVDSTIYGGGGRTLTDSNRNNASDLSYDEIKYSAENVKINIEGGTVNGDVYGGALKYSGVKSSEINVSAGTVNGNLYGAGGEDGSGKFTLLSENAKINLSGGKITGNVYGGGSNQTALVKGDVFITVSNDVQIDGTIYGTANGSVVEGTKNLSIESFNGSALSVSDFNKIEISADSKVVLSDAFDVDTLIVEVPTFSTDAQVTLVEGTKFDTLTLVGDFEQNQINLNTVFGDSVGVVLSALEDKTALTVIDSNGQEWATENLSSENGILSFEKGAAIPEPSTYAVIFGAIALGFVAYRRRK